MGSGGSGPRPKGTKDSPLHTVATQDEQEKADEKAEQSKPDKDPEALGHGLVKGAFQELGFPDVFGKPPTEWGAYKLAMGGLGYGKSLLDWAGQGQGGTGSPGGGSAAPGGGGDPFAVLDSLFAPPGQKQGEGLPGPADVAGAMAPSESPANVPAIAQIGPQGGATANFYGVDHNTAQQSWKQFQEHDVNTSRQTAISGGAGTGNNP